MNCTNCGQPLDNGAAFCGNCGQPVQQVSNPASTPAFSPTIVQTNEVQPTGTIQNPTIVSQEQPQVVTQSQTEAPVQPAQFQPQQAIPEVAPLVAPSVQPQSGLPSYAVPQTEVAHTKNATVSLIMGIASIILSIIPILGLAIGTTAIILSNKAKKIVPKSGKAKAGLVLGIIGIALSLVAWAYNISAKANSTSSSTAIVQTLR